MPSEKQARERIENLSAILRFLRCGEGKSRREIAAALGLSWGSVSEMASLLLAKGLLHEKEAESTTFRGRKPTELVLSESVNFLGVDINRNGLCGCVCDFYGKKVAEFDGNLEYMSKKDFVNSVSKFISDTLSEYKDIHGIAIAMQGIFSSKTNEWQFSRENNIYVNFDTDFGDFFTLPVKVEHDPNCILYSCLESENERSMIIRIDRGIGVGICDKGVFLNDFLLEAGFMAVNERGDCLHDIISELRDKETSDAILCRARRYLGIAVGNICNLFGVNKIYFCGDMVFDYNLLGTAFFEAYEKTVIPNHAAEVTSVKICDAAYGAAKIALESFEV